MKKKILLLCIALIIFLPFVYMADDGKDDVVFYEDDLQTMTNESDAAEYVTGVFVNPGEIVSHIPPLLLEKGSYDVTIDFLSASDNNYVDLNNNGVIIDTKKLLTAEQTAEFSFSLLEDSQELWLLFHHDASQALQIKSVTISAKTSFYLDIYLVLFLIVLGAAILFYVANRTWEGEKKTKLIVAFIILCTGIYATYPLFTNIVLHADDLSYHLLRIEGIKDGLLDGQFPVMIFPQALEGNGYLNAMYPSLFLYIPALLRICRMSLFTSYKIYILLFNILTAYLMYLSVKSVSNSKKAAVLAAVLYTLFPYRFTNLYARGAVGELSAMAFFPLFFAGLYHVMAGKKEKWYYLVIAMTGLLQTHILSVLLASMISVIFGIGYIKRIIIEKRYIAILRAVFWFGILNLWYLIPFLMYFLRGSLWSNSLDWSTFEEYAQNVFALFTTINPESFRSYSLGLAMILCVGISVYYLIFEKRKNREDAFLFQLLIVGLICAYVGTNFFSGWAVMKNPLISKLLTSIQFPWRLLTISGAVFAMAGCIWLSRLQLGKEYKMLIAFFLLGLTIVSTLKAIDIPVYESLDATVSVGHVDKVVGVPYSKGRNLCYPYDWRLGGSNNESLVSTYVLSDKENITVSDYQKKGTHALVSYRTTSTDTYIELPLLAYKGYAAYDENHNKLQIHKEADSCNRIRIYLNADGKEHKIIVSFKGYWFMHVANLLSLTAAAAIVLLYFKNRTKTEIRDGIVEE